MSKTFLIGSCEPFSGKSALVLGIARNLIASNHLVRFGKPLATSLELNVSERGDIQFKTSGQWFSKSNQII